MRAVIASLVLALSASPLIAQREAYRPLARQVITAETLRLAGVRSLSDILPLIDDWNSTSIDGFTWQASPQGLSSFGRPTWSVMLDGQVIELNIFGVQSLNRIPLTPGQIDSVVVVTTPELQNGVMADGGVIHIYSRRPGRRLRVQAQLGTANETGDPGPFRFTELATPNIDRIGTSVSGAVAYGWTGAYAEVGGLWQEHFVTEPRIRRRNMDISIGAPIIKQSAISLMAGAAAAGGRHNLFVGRSWTRDYYFLKQYGREVPVESPYTHAGVDGTLPLSRRNDFRYRAAYTSNALEKHDNALDLDFDWRQDRWLAQIELARRARSYRATLGLGLTGANAKTGYDLSEDAFTLFELYGEAVYDLGPNTRQTVDVKLTSSEGEVALKAALAHQTRLASAHRIEAVFSYLERLPEEDGRIWYWHRRGYGFLPDNGVDVVVKGGLRKTRTIGADLNWVARLGRGVDLRLGGYVRWLSRLALEEQLFAFDSTSGAFSGPVLLESNQDGELGGAQVGLDWRASQLFGLSSYYRFQDILGGRRLFEATWRTVPRHKLRVTATFTPWSSVGIWAMLLYRSSSEWSDYEAAASQTSGLYNSRVAEAWSVELALQKWFWGRRARLHLLFRNIANDAVPLHPIGAAYGLTFAVQGELFLRGL